jgi:hypothetical protein
MTLRCPLNALFAVCVVVVSTHAQADEAITPEAAHAIGVDAYFYFYPLVTMDITRLQSVNIESGKGRRSKSVQAA